MTSRLQPKRDARTRDGILPYWSRSSDSCLSLKKKFGLLSPSFFAFAWTAWCERPSSRAITSIVTVPCRAHSVSTSVVVHQCFGTPFMPPEHRFAIAIIGVIPFPPGCAPCAAIRGVRFLVRCTGLPQRRLEGAASFCGGYESPWFLRPIRLAAFRPMPRTRQWITSGEREFSACRK